MPGSSLGRYLRRYLINSLVTAIALATMIIAAVIFVTRPQLELPHNVNPNQNSESVERHQEQRYTFIGVVPEGWTAIFTAFLATFTGVLTVVSFVQIKYLTRADRTASNAANAAIQSNIITRQLFITENRPWIAVNVDLVGQQLYNNDGMRINLNVRCKNIGKTPAFNVSSGFIRFSKQPDQTEVIRTHKSAMDAMEILGRTIFPDAHEDFGHAIFVTNDQINATWEANNPSGLMKNIRICVVYKSPVTDVIHETSFTVVINPMRPLPRSGDTVEFLSKIELVKLPFGSVVI